MNALAIAMVKNESDLIEAFVRHHVHYVDLLVVIDNGSTDGTREILTQLQREGLPLLVFDDPVVGYYQSEKVTHVYRKVAPIFQPELVYLLDADEFIRAPGRCAIEAQLALLSPGEVGLLAWETHLPSPSAHDGSAPVASQPLASLPLRRRVEAPTYYKAVIRRRPEHDDRLLIEQGNHAVRYTDGTRPRHLQIQGAALAHFPVRTVAQLTAKVIIGWHAYLVKNRHAPPGSQAGAGFQWHDLYQRVVRGQGIDHRTLAQVAMDYAQNSPVARDPVADAVHAPFEALHGDLRHLHLGRTDALAKVALNMETFLAGDAVRDPAIPDPEAVVDVAPLRALFRQLQPSRVASTASPSARRARALLLGLEPGAQPWEVGGAGAPPDWLLAPVTEWTELVAMVSEARSVAQALVAWRTGGSVDPLALRRGLEAAAAQGWHPHLLRTMSLRALGSTAAMRHGGIVFERADGTAPAPRQAAIRDLLTVLEGQPRPVVRPAVVQVIRHPMQDLALEPAGA